MLELVSVHVPKCGGTSLADTLKRRYGWGLRLVYPPAERPVRARLRGLARSAWHSRPHPRAIHGHFPASRYADTSAKMITFVRDPVEMRVSQWHFIRRENARTGAVHPSWQVALDLDLADYVARPAGALGFIDVPLDRFCFIGRMDRFDADMRRLAAMLEVEPASSWRRANPLGPIVIPADWRRRYAAANPRDTEIYASILCATKAGPAVVG